MLNDRVSFLRFVDRWDEDDDDVPAAAPEVVIDRLNIDFLNEEPLAADAAAAVEAGSSLSLLIEFGLCATFIVVFVNKFDAFFWYS